MHTLFDFITRTDAAEYALMLLFIFGFIVFLQIMKPGPFKRLRELAAGEMRFLKSQDRNRVFRFARNAALAPAYFAFYLISLPFLFTLGLTEPLATAQWSPVRAYFTGKKAHKSANKGKGRP